MFGEAIHHVYEWKEVTRRPFRNWFPSWDFFPSGRRPEVGGDAKVISGYFSEFLDKYRARNFFELFGCIGEVVEVAIAPRRKKFGKKFGFARFKEDMDVRLLVEKLDNGIVDRRKIQANLPIFETFRSINLVNCSKAMKFSRFKNQSHRNDNIVRDGNGFNLKRENKSFADVLVNKQVKENSVEFRCLRFSLREVNRNRISKTKVGVVNSFGSSYRIQSILEKEGNFNIRVFVVGPNIVLLEEDNEISASKEFLEEHNLRWKRWFKEGYYGWIV